MLPFAVSLIPGKLIRCLFKVISKDWITALYSRSNEPHKNHVQIVALSIYI